MAGSCPREETNDLLLASKTVDIIHPMPGEDRASKKASIDTSGIQGPSTSTFRPPPGFMDAENPTAQAYGPLDPDEARDALNRLRVQAGHWHELAKLLPRLAAAGYDSKAVESETGLERARQNCWVVAQQVKGALRDLPHNCQDTQQFKM